MEVQVLIKFPKTFKYTSVLLDVSLSLALIAATYCK